MNKLQYRIVFNKRRGQMMAVAETAVAQGKQAGQSPAPSSSTGCLVATLRPLKFALWAALGMVLWSQPLVHAQVVADPNAPGHQRPTILPGNNGAVVVNIQTPSNAGVSRNTYTQFDVAKPGVILNNSRSGAETQLGGFVAANPWLATGGARIILNEVNSSNPSQLRGYVEVAGQRAEVIIANPAGIAVDGGGFINASKATLTTGVPLWTSAGGIDGFRVERGSISVGSGGLDLTRTDYSSILARAAEINGSLWGSNVHVITGANVVGSDDTVRQVLPASADGKPRFALDVAQLGGMYAGKIYLIGTEAGVGVRNAGGLGSKTGELVLRNDGALVNSGTLDSAADADVQVTGPVHNTGSIYAGGKATVIGAQGVDNSGSIAAQGSTQVKATASGANVSSTAGSMLAAGVDRQGQLQGHESLIVEASGSAQANGRTAASGDVIINGTRVDTSGGQLNAQNVTLAASSGDVNTQGARTGAVQALTVQTPGAWRNDGGQASGGSLNVQAHDLSNVQGSITQTGTRATTLQLAGSLNNAGGRIATNGQSLTLSAAELNNSQGRIEHTGSGTAQVSAGQSLNNSQGQILSNGSALDVQAPFVNNNGGTLGAGAGQLTVQANQLLNEGGQLTSGKDLDLSTPGDLNNTGNLSARGNQNLAVGGALTNTGSISAGGNNTIQASSVTSAPGSTLAAGGDLSVNTSGNLTAQGSNLAGGALSLQGASVDLAGSTTGAGGNATVTATSGDVNTQGARISTPGSLQLSAPGQLNNASGQLSAGQLGIQAGSVNNQSGKLVQTGGGTLTVTASNGLDNTTGLISSNGAVQVSGATLNNTGGGIVGAGGDVSVASAGALINTGGRIAGNASVSVSAGGALANDGGSIAGQTLTVSAQGISNVGGTLSGTATARIDAGSGAINNTGGTLAGGQHLAVTGGDLLNSGGTIQATGGDAALHVAQLTNDQGGRIFASGNLSTTASSLTNSGNVYAGGNQSLSATGAVTNTGVLASGGNTTITATSVTSTTGSVLGAGVGGDGKLVSSGDLTVTANPGNVTLQGQNLAGGNLTLTGTGVDLAGSTTVAGGAAQFNAGTGGLNLAGAQLNLGSFTLDTAGAFNNQDGQLNAGAIRLHASAVNNQGGQLIQSGTGAMSVSAANALNNTTGLIASNGSASVSAGSITNTDGKIQVAGTGALDVSSAGDLTNTRGQIAGNSAVSVTAAGQLLNDNATISGQSLALKAASINNTAGTLTGTDAATVDAGSSLNNTDGKLQTNGDLSLAATRVNNTRGLITAQGNASLTGASGGITNTSGTIAAAKDLGIAGGGDLLNSQGNVQAGGNATLDVAQLTNDNGGRVFTGGNLSTTASGVTNTGNLYAGGNQSLNVTGAIANTGVIAAAGNTTLNAASLNSTATSVLGAGIGADGTVGTSGDLAISTTGQLTAQASNLAGGALNLSGAGIDLAGSTTSAGGNTSLASTGDLNTQGVQLTTPGSLTMTAAGLLNNDAGTINAGQLTAQAGTLSNVKGELVQSGTGAMSVSATNTLNNTTGLIASNGSASVSAGAITNTDGKIQVAGTGALDVASAGDLTNTRGQIAGNSAVSVTAGGQLLNDSGTVSGQSLTVKAASINNTAGTLTGVDAATVDAGAVLNNTGGKLQTHGDLVLVATAVNNTDGQIAAGGNATLSGVSGGVNNTRGTLIADQNLSLQGGGDLVNTSGTVQAGAQANLQLGQLTNDQSGRILAGGNLETNATGVSNTGNLYAGGNQSLTASGAITNSGVIASAGNTTVHAASLNSTATSVLGAGIGADGKVGTSGDLSITTTGQLTAQGSNLAGAAMNLSGAGINLAGSTTSAGSTASLNSTGDLTTQGIQLTTPGSLTMTAAGLLNNDAGKINAGQLTAQAGALSNVQGELIQSGTGAMSVSAANALNNTTGLIASNGSASVSAGAITNTDGKIQVAGTGALDVASAGDLTNTRGQIAGNSAVSVTAGGQLLNDSGTVSGQSLTVNAASINNTAGTLTGTNAATIDAGSSLNNTDGKLQTNGDLSLAATRVNNTSGLITAQGNASLTGASGGITNTSGTIAAAKDLGIAGGGDLLNSQGNVQAGGNATLQVAQLTNDNGGRVFTGGNLSTTASGVTNTGNLYAGGNQSLTVTGAIANTGVIAAAGNTIVNAASLSSTATSVLGAGIGADGTVGTSGDLAISTTGQLTAQGSNLAAGNATLQGAAVDLSGVQAHQNVVLTSTQGNLSSAGDVIGGGNVTAQSAGALSVGGALAAAGAATLNSAGDMHLGAQSVAGGDLSATSGGALQAGLLQSGANLTLTSAGAASTGNLLARNQLTAHTDGGLAVQGNATAAAIDLHSSAGSVTVSDTLATPGRLNVSAAGDVTASVLQGGMDGGAATTVQAGRDVRAGTLQAGGAYTAQAGQDHSVTGELTVVGLTTVGAGRDLSVGGKTTTAGLVASAGNQMHLQGDVLVVGDSSTQSGAGQAYGGKVEITGASTARAGGDLTVAGDLLVNQGIDWASSAGAARVGGALATRGTAQVSAANGIDVTGDAQFKNASFTSSAGGVHVGGATQSVESFTVSARDDVKLDGATTVGGNFSGTSSAGSIQFGNTLQVQGDFSADAYKDLRFMGDSLLLGNTSMQARTGTIDNRGTMSLGKDLVIHNAGDFSNEGTIQSAGKIQVQARNISTNLSQAGGILSNDSVSLQASGSTTVGAQGNVIAKTDMALGGGAGVSNAGKVQAGGALTATGPSLTNTGLVAAQTVNVAGNLSNAGQFYGDQSITVQGSTSNAGTGQIAASSVNLSATDNSGQIGGTTVSLGSTTNHAVISGGQVSIAGDLTNHASIAANTLTVNAGSLENNGALSAVDMTLQGSSTVNRGQISASNSLTMTGAFLTNDLSEGKRCINPNSLICQQPNSDPNNFRWTQTPGTIYAGNTLTVQFTDLTNKGVINSAGFADVRASRDFTNTRSPNDLFTDANAGSSTPSTNTGVIGAGGMLNVVAGNLVNSGGQLQAGGRLNVNATGSFKNSTPVDGLVGQVSGSGLVNVVATSIDNQGLIQSANETVTLQATNGGISNSTKNAVIASGQTTQLTATGAINNGAQASILGDQKVQIQGTRFDNAGTVFGRSTPAQTVDVQVDTGFTNAGSGIVIAGDKLDIKAATYANSGVVGSFGDARLVATGTTLTPANSIIAKRNLNLQVAGITVGVGESWVADSDSVSWTGLLSNQGSVAIRGNASGNAINQATGQVTKFGRPPNDLSYSYSAPAGMINPTVDSYTDVATRARLYVGGTFSGTLTNIASDVYAGGAAATATPQPIGQTVYWTGRDASGNTYTTWESGTSESRVLIGGGASSLTLTGSYTGTIVADNLHITGHDLVVPAGIDPLSGQGAVQAAQGHNTTTGQGSAAGVAQTVAGTVMSGAAAGQIAAGIAGAAGGVLIGSAGNAGTGPGSASQPLLVRVDGGTPFAYVPGMIVSGNVIEVTEPSVLKDQAQASGVGSTQGVGNAAAIANAAAAAFGPFAGAGPAGSAGFNAIAQTLNPSATAGVPMTPAQQYAALLTDTSSFKPTMPDWQNLSARTGTITANDLSLDLSGRFINRGGFEVTNNFNLHAAGGIDNADSILRAGGWLHMTGGSQLEQGQAALNNDRGTIQAGRIWASLDGDIIANEGKFLATNRIDLDTRGNMTLVASQVKGNGVSLNADGLITIGARQINAKTGSHTDLFTTYRMGQTDGTDGFDVSEKTGSTSNSVTSVKNIGSLIDAGTGSLSITAGRDLNVIGSDLKAGQNIALSGANVKVEALKDRTVTETETHKSGYDQRTYKVEESLVGGNVTAGGGVSIRAGGNIVSLATGEPVKDGNLTLTGAHIKAEKGPVVLVASHDIRAQAVTTENSKYVEEYASSSGFLGLGKKSTQTVTNTITTTANGTLVQSGQGITAIAGHDIDSIGSQFKGGVGADPKNPETTPAQVVLMAGNNISLIAAQNTKTETNSSQTKKSGLFTGGPTLVGIGSNSGAEGSTTVTTTNVASAADSATGNVVMIAGLNPDKPTPTEKRPDGQPGQAGEAEQKLPGGTILLAGSNATAANGRVILSGENVVLANTLETTVTTTNSAQNSGGLSLISLTPSGKKVAAESTSATANAVLSNVSGGQGVSIEAPGLVSVTGGNLDAGAGRLHIKGGVVDLGSTTNATQTTASASSKKTGMGAAETIAAGIHKGGDGINAKSQSDTEGLQTTLATSTLKGKGIDITSTQGNITLGAVRFDAGGQDLTLDSKDKVNFAAIATTDAISTSSSGSDLAWQRMQSKGHQTETLNYTQINNANLVIKAPGGVTVDMGAQQSAQQLAQQPGLAWMGQVATDPNLAGKINWNQIETAHKNWDYKQSGMTPAAAAVVTIVVAYLTAGAGTELAGTATTVGTTTTTTLGGVTLSTATAAGTSYTAAGMMANAAFTTLATQASIAVINNNGDPLKALKELGSSQNVKQLTAAIITSGIMAGVSDSMGWNDPSKTADWTTKLGQNLSSNITQATVNSAVGLGNFQDNLKGAIVGAILNSAAAGMAGWVGDNTGDGKLLDSFGNKVAHAVVGCAMGAATQGSGSGCAAGALGAVVGEAAAELFNGGNANAAAFTKQFAQIVAVVTAAVAGQDVNTAMLAANNSVNNNYLKHTEINQLISAKKSCDAGNQISCVKVIELNALDAKRQQQLASCTGVSNPACDKLIQEAATSFDELVIYQQVLFNKIKAGEVSYTDMQPYLNKAANETKDIASHLKDYFYLKSNNDVSSPAWATAKSLEGLNTNDLSNLWGAAAAIGSSRKFTLHSVHGESISVKPLTEAERIQFNQLTDSPLYTVTKIQRGEDINATIPSSPGSGWVAPYKAGEVVVDVFTSQPMSFVRVYREGENYAVGSWMVSRVEIDGLSPAQIQFKLGLDKPPTHIVNVDVPAGVPLQISLAGEQPGFGMLGGAQQIRIDRNVFKSEWFSNSRRLSQ